LNILFSCIIDNYDRLKEVNLPEGWRAICFSNTPIESKTWEIVKIEKKDKIYRDIKIRPYAWLPKHDKSVWIDGNLEINIPLDKFIEGKYGFWLMKHPDRNCLYEEAKRCIELGKDNAETISKQINEYRNVVFPEQFGLSATGCIIRDNDKYNSLFSDYWWKEVEDNSVRDQLSFDFIRWMMPGMKINHFPFLENIIYHQHVHKEKKPRCFKRRKVYPTKEYYRRYNNDKN